VVEFFVHQASCLGALIKSFSTSLRAQPDKFMDMESVVWRLPLHLDGQNVSLLNSCTLPPYRAFLHGVCGEIDFVLARVNYVFRAGKGLRSIVERNMY
jgi:hypothetical protein